MSTTATLPAPAAATGCCPPFEPSAYHERETVLTGRKFVKLSIPSVLHVPVGMSGKIARASARIEAAGAAVPSPLMLSDERSAWGSDLYLEVAREVPGLPLIELVGTYLSRVYDGPYRELGRWARETERWVKGKGREVEKLYFGYAYCPKCAKAYGHNYVTVFAKLR